MKLQGLIEVARAYEEALREHAMVDHAAAPHTHVDICSHLHAEVSELFNVLRKKKAEHQGMSYEEGILDELQDILCIWCLAVNLLVPDADVDAMIRNCAELFRAVAKKKKGADTELSLPINPSVTIAKGENLLWEPSSTGVPGFKKKVLVRSPDLGIVTFFQFERQARYPEFTLNGSARYYILDGKIEMCGAESASGTFIHCEDGTKIEPFPIEIPCTVLCIYERLDYRK